MSSLRLSGGAPPISTPWQRALTRVVAVSDSAGRFMFVGVPAGQYTLQSEVMPPPSGPNTPPPPASRGGWVNDPVTVSEGGVAGLTLTFRPGVQISGRIVFDGSKPPPPPDLITRLAVSLEPNGFGVNRTESLYLTNFDRNGQFVMSRVPPGRYVMTFRAFIADRRAMPDWETGPITLNGKDISDHPFTITDDINGIIVTQTDHNSELTGTVRDAAGNTDATAAVLLFTAERDLWTVRTVRCIRSLRASEKGVYSVRGVQPGDYYLVAIPDADMGDYPDPRMLDSLTHIATRIAMGPSERKTQDLVVKTIK